MSNAHCSPVGLIVAIECRGNTTLFEMKACPRVGELIRYDDISGKYQVGIVREVQWTPSHSDIDVEIRLT